MLFKWKDSYSCNIKEIDNQHKRLFELGAELYDIASLKDDFDHYDEIMTVLNELEEYTVYHFSHEEKMMEEQKYSNYDNHKIEHDFFVKKLKKLANADIDENQSESVMQIITFVADWITSHILKTDMQYRQFFNSKGIY